DHVRLAVALHQHHVPWLGVGQRHRLPAIALQVARQGVHRGAGLAAIDQPRLLQAGGDEVRAVDVVRYPALHRQLIAVLEFAGVAADELLRDRRGVVAADPRAARNAFGTRYATGSIPAAAARRTGDVEGVAGIDQVGVLDLRVGVHQRIDAGAVALRDLRERGGRDDIVDGHLASPFRGAVRGDARSVRPRPPSANPGPAPMGSTRG